MKKHALHKAFSNQFPDAQGLRCFKHVQISYRDKLREPGLKSRKQQDIFVIHTTFGIQGQDDGIVEMICMDVWIPQKSSFESTEREYMNNSSHTPKYWKYLDNIYSMIESHMLQSVRVKRGKKANQ